MSDTPADETTPAPDFHENEVADVMATGQAEIGTEIEEPDAIAPEPAEPDEPAEYAVGDQPEADGGTQDDEAPA